nr:unnamed protein product [Callosobruchus analis]
MHLRILPDHFSGCPAVVSFRKKNEA